MRRICAPTDHMYDAPLKSRQVEFVRRNKQYTINATVAIMCSKCGDILFPEYPDKLGMKELEKLSKLIDKRDAKSSKSVRPRRKDE